MNTGRQVTFTADFFRPIPGEDEDFWWVVMVSRQPFMLWLACSNTKDSTNEWMVYSVAEYLRCSAC